MSNYPKEIVVGSNEESINDISIPSPESIRIMSQDPINLMNMME